MRSCLAVFDQNRHGMTPMPHPSYSPNLPPSRDEKSPQRETFAHVEEVKQKTAEALKGIKTDKFKNWSSGKNFQ